MVTDRQEAFRVTEKHTISFFSRGEQISGLTWLSIGAVLSLFIEVLYLNVWIGGVPAPLTVVVAFLFNMVLTKTALLWSSKTAVALIPTYFWIAGYLALVIYGSITGDNFLGSDIRSILLLLAGISGSGWALARQG